MLVERGNLSAMHQFAPEADQRERERVRAARSLALSRRLPARVSSASSALSRSRTFRLDSSICLSISRWMLFWPHPPLTSLLEAAAYGVGLGVAAVFAAAAAAAASHRKRTAAKVARLASCCCGWAMFATLKNSCWLKSGASGSKRAQANSE